MLDVHVPQKSEHTWTDFTIHIATICVGLLIAVGLEQGVEWLHHRHELHSLREDLREEDEKVLRDNADELRVSTLGLAWLDQRMAAVQEGIRQHKPVPYIPPPGVRARSSPDDHVWRAAKASNLIEVMPQQDIKAYSEVDALLDQYHEIARNHAASANLSAFERQFRVSPESRVLDLSSATHADLVEELRLLSIYRSNIADVRAFNLFVDGAVRAVLQGERDLDRIDDAENKDYVENRR